MHLSNSNPELPSQRGCEENQGVFDELPQIFSRAVNSQYICDIFTAQLSHNILHITKYYWSARPSVKDG
jgi:hypothetical protein